MKPELARCITTGDFEEYVAKNVRSGAGCLAVCRRALEMPFSDSEKAAIMASAYYFTAHAYVSSHYPEISDEKREAMHDKIAKNTAKYATSNLDDLAFLTDNNLLGSRLAGTFSIVKPKQETGKMLSHKMSGREDLNPEVAREQLERELEVKKILLDSIKQRTGSFGFWLRCELKKPGIPDISGENCEATADDDKQKLLFTLNGRGSRPAFEAARRKCLEGLYSHPELRPAPHTEKIVAQITKRPKSPSV